MTIERKCTICIVDNHAIFREGIKALLTARPQYEVIAEAEDGFDVINAIKNRVPNLVLLDLTMPKKNGLDVIKTLKSQFPGLKIIVLTLHNTEQYIHAALSSGADAYVVKEASYAELELAIDAVLRNQTFLSPAIARKVVNQYMDGTKSDRTTPSWENLTKREREHLKLIAEGYSNKLIAELLCISVKTVEKHRGNLLKKLGMHNAAQLTTFAIENDLIESITDERV
jgi:two-component system, NarL family, response regulator NreC